MRCTLLFLVPFVCLLGAHDASAGILQSAKMESYCSNGWANGWSERRAMRRLFPGRMQLTLGDMHRRHFMERCQVKRRLHSRTSSSWSRWHDPYGRFAGHFYGFNDVYGAGRPILRPRSGWRSFHLRYELAPAQEKAPRRMLPSQDAYAAHLAWCHAKYRSFRAGDNTFQPYRGPRKRCSSPYGR